MRKQSTAILASVLLVLTALVLGSLVQYAFYVRDGAEIVLPGSDLTAQDPVDQVALQNKELLETLVVDSSNIGLLLKNLARPEMYHWEGRVTMYGGGTSGQTMVSADAEGVKLRVSLRKNGSTAIEEYLLTDCRYYAWERGDTAYYSGKRGDFTASEIMMTVTYEDLLTMPQEAFLQAGVQWDGDLECLVIAVRDPASGYRMDYRIAVDDGMLISMTASLEGQVIYQAERLILETGVVRIGAFNLPDGTQPEVGAP